MLRAWLELARISNLPTVWTNVTAGWLLAGWPLQHPALPWLLLAGSLLYSGGMILNDAADVKFDRAHRCDRPIPSGRIGLAPAWMTGLGMLALGASLALHWQASPALTAALAAAILAYDLYHKPWSGSVWIMGACRSLLVLLAASLPAGDGPLPTGAVLPHALALGAYVVGLTLIARQEARGTPVAFWRALLVRGLLIAPGALAAAALPRLGAGPRLTSLLLIALFALLVARATRLMRQGGAAIGQAVGLLLAGIALVDALAVARLDWPLALGLAALVPLLRLWQRLVAAT